MDPCSTNLVPRVGLARDSPWSRISDATHHATMRFHVASSRTSNGILIFEVIEPMAYAHPVATLKVRSRQNEADADPLISVPAWGDIRS